MGGDHNVDTKPSTSRSCPQIAKTLRALPVAELESPTVTLVGAPNVGKSSLVRLFSSGKPEVQNYPFTTRGIQMGHIVVEEKRFVFTDTPGVLPRPDGARAGGKAVAWRDVTFVSCSCGCFGGGVKRGAEGASSSFSDDALAGMRNRMERLTLATLAYLPVHVLFVMDLSGGCGTKARRRRQPRAVWWCVVLCARGLSGISLPLDFLFVLQIADQLVIRDELLERFPEHTWLARRRCRCRPLMSFPLLPRRGASSEGCPVAGPLS